MQYIIATDIGGTTFNTGIFSSSLEQIAISNKDKIRYYNNKNEVVNAILEQINSIINENSINKSDIIGVGVASPGPLDSKKGIILDTLNLKIFQNYNIVDDFSKKLGLDTFIENDANLFSLGEWYSQYKKKNVTVGVTLGTGLGFGLIINGKIFTNKERKELDLKKDKDIKSIDFQVSTGTATDYITAKKNQVIYAEPTVFQKRNKHNYLNDFNLELLGYKNNILIILVLIKNIRVYENYSKKKYQDDIRMASDDENFQDKKF